MTPPVQDIAARLCVTSQFSPIFFFFFFFSFFAPQQVIYAKKTQSGIPERRKPVELYQPSGRLAIYTSVAQPKPFTHHLLPARIRVSAGLPGSRGAAQGFSSKIEFIAKNVLISDSSYLH